MKCSISHVKATIAVLEGSLFGDVQFSLALHILMRKLPVIALKNKTTYCMPVMPIIALTQSGETSLFTMFFFTQAAGCSQMDLSLSGCIEIFINITYVARCSLWTL